MYIITCMDINLELIKDEMKINLDICIQNFNIFAN